MLLSLEQVLLVSNTSNSDKLSFKDELDSDYKKLETLDGRRKGEGRIRYWGKARQERSPEDRENEQKYAATRGEGKGGMNF